MFEELDKLGSKKKYLNINIIIYTNLLININIYIYIYIIDCRIKLMWHL